MRGVRVAGLAMLVAAVAACLGPATASADEATTLCVVNAEACKAEDFAGEAFTATSSGETFFEFGGLGTVNCSSSMSRDEAEQIVALSFTGCTGGCSVKAVNLPYKTDLTEPALGDGVLIVASLGGEARLAVACGANECLYSVWAVATDVTGGEPAGIAISLSMPELTKSFFCPKTAQWEGLYEFTTPSSSVYVVKKAFEGPMFCLENVAVCPQNAIADELWAELQPKTSFKVTKLIGGTVGCASTGFLLHDVINKFSPGPWRQKTFLLGECTHPVYGECALKREPLGYLAHLSPFGGGSGEVAITGEAGKEATLRIACTAEEEPFECLYSTEEFWLEFEGGEQATMEEIGSMARVEGPATYCPASVLVRGSYEVLKSSGGGAQLYLTET